MFRHFKFLSDNCPCIFSNFISQLSTKYEVKKHLHYYYYISLVNSLPVDYYDHGTKPIDLDSSKNNLLID